MLRAFGFITHVHHPHKQMLNYCQVIRADQAHHALMQEAWSIVNDRWAAQALLCLVAGSKLWAC